MADVAYTKSPQGKSAITLNAANIAYLPQADFWRARDGLRRRHAEIDPSLQSLIDAMPAQVAILDGDTRVIAINASWRQVGIDGGDPTGRMAIGHNYIDVCAEAERASRDARIVRRGLWRLRSGARSQFTHQYSVTIRKEKRHFIVHAAHFRCGGELILISHTDVTDSPLRTSERRQYCLSLLLAEEEERKRIARELHDETSQQLALMQFGLMALRSAGDGADIEQACSRIEEALSSVQHQVRTLSYVLHPPELDKAGIADALMSFVKGFGRRAGLAAEFNNVAGQIRLSRDAEIAFYRVAQEALVNVHKHASASKVSVRLKRGVGELILEIEDNGVGISQDVATARRSGALGVGLVGMRERIEALAGKLDISRLPVGTLVTARVPRRRGGEF